MTKDKYDYHPLMEISVNSKKRIFLRTGESSYFEDMTEAIAYISKKRKILIITFDFETRDMVNRIEKNEGNLSNIGIIDCLSILIGRGTPPVHNLMTIYRPDSFNDIEVYTNFFINKNNDEEVIVAIVSMHNLKQYQNENEIGIFLDTFKNNMKSKNIPVVVIDDMGLGYLLAQIINRFVQKVIPMKKTEGLIE
jgi:hypothetical protein